MMYNGRERSKQGEKRGFYGFVALKDCFWAKYNFFDPDQKSIMFWLAHLKDLNTHMVILTLPGDVASDFTRPSTTRATSEALMGNAGKCWEMLGNDGK